MFAVTTNVSNTFVNAALSRYNCVQAGLNIHSLQGTFYYTLYAYLIDLKAVWPAAS